MFVCVYAHVCGCMCVCGHACEGSAEAYQQYDPVKEGTSSYSVMLEHGGMVDGLVAVGGQTGGSQWTDRWQSLDGPVAVIGRTGGSQWTEWWQSVDGPVAVIGRTGGSQWTEWWQSVDGPVAVIGRTGGSQWTDKCNNGYLAMRQTAEKLAVKDTTAK